MATKPAKPCLYPRCPGKALSGSAYCDKHRKQRRRESEVNRPSPAVRGYGARHQKWREIILARDPLCVICLAEGRTVPSKVADHIIPLSQGGDWTPENGQGLCESCHNRKTAKEREQVMTWQQD